MVLTALEFLLGMIGAAIIIMLGVILFELRRLREAVNMLALRESVRRGWVRREHDEGE